jgi:hypothetical protein
MLLREPAASGAAKVSRYHRIVVVVLICSGLAVGLVLGRWWALLTSVAVGLWIGLSNEVDVPGWYLGLVYAALSGLGIAAGVLLRRRLSNGFVKPTE